MSEGASEEILPSCQQRKWGAHNMAGCQGDWLKAASESRLLLGFWVQLMGVGPWALWSGHQLIQKEP